MLPILGRIHPIVKELLLKKINEEEEEEEEDEDEEDEEEEEGRYSLLPRGDGTIATGAKGGTGGLSIWIVIPLTILF